MIKEIKLESIINSFEPGFLAMDKNGKWCWYKHKPHINENKGLWLRDEIEHPWCDLRCLNIEKTDDWKNSLIQIF